MCALPATDTFTGADHTVLTTYSANWTLCLGNFELHNNALKGFAWGNIGAGWDADAFNADQYATATMAAVIANVFIGVAVRCDVTTPNDTYYAWYSDNTTGSYLIKMLDGVETQLGSIGAVFAANDIIRLEISGVDAGTLTPMKNGVLLNPPNTQTDSAIDSGAAGVSGYDQGESARIDNWEGGNLAAAGVSKPIAMHYYRQRRTT